MADIDVDPQLIGSLAETYYKEYSDQKGGWAFTSLENIHNNFENDVLEFKVGFYRLKIKIPQQLVPEIKQMSQPRDIDGSPSFVFDFLACKVYDDEDISGVITLKTPENFRWIEVKSEGGRVSKNQLQAFESIKIPYTLVVVHNVKKTPYDVYLKFYDEVPDSMTRY